MSTHALYFLEIAAEKYGILTPLTNTSTDGGPTGPYAAGGLVVLAFVFPARSVPAVVNVDGTGGASIVAETQVR